MQTINLSNFQNQVLDNNTLLNSTNQIDLLPFLLDLQRTMSEQQRMLQLLLENEQKKHLKLHQYPSEIYAIPSNNSIISPNDSHSSHFRESPVFVSNDIFEDGHSSESLINHENSDWIVPKEEDYSGQVIKREPIFNSYESSPGVQNDIREHEEFTQRETPFKIIRRNGFKQKLEVAEPKEENICQNHKPSSLTSKPKVSKANHLWVNYGRKIIEFALTQTKDEARNKIKLLVGKLQFKRDFQAVFEVKANDSESERQFKILFGNIALFFIHYKAEEAFQDSKLKEQMISQKEIVSSFIKKSITQVCFLKKNFHQEVHLVRNPDDLN